MFLINCASGTEHCAYDWLLIMEAVVLEKMQFCGTFFKSLAKCICLY